MATTLFDLAGAAPAPARLSQGVLVLIDVQNEYFDGPLRLDGVEAAAGRVAELLARARRLGTPVIHVRHRGKPGGAFDPDAPRGQIHDSVAPQAGELVIDKALPNAFAGTTLADALEAHPGKPLVIAGFMTHLCVSSTARAALDHACAVTVVSDATATRDLPDVHGGIVAAPDLQRAALAALADRFAVVRPAADIPE